MTITTVATAPDSGLGLDARRVDRRREIYAARRNAWAVTTLKRVRLCGWAPRSDDGVQIRVTECEGIRRAGVGNVQSCGSFWACPVCSEKIAARRAEQIASVLRWWVDAEGDRSGGRRVVALVTLTVRHRPWNRLRTVWDTVSEGWRKALSGRSWKADQEVHGVPMTRRVMTGKRAGQLVTANRIRTIRVVEVTHGRSGWHVHVHALLLLAPGTRQADVDVIAAGMFDRWTAVAVDRLGMAPTEAHGVDARVIHGDPATALSDYFVKAAFSASHEVAGGMRKTARMGNRTPFGILADLCRDGLADDLDLWSEWEEVSKGRRAVGFTPGLLAEAAVSDATDEEIADEELDGEVVAVIHRHAWRSIRWHDGICDLLEAFESSTAHGLAMLAAWESIADPLRDPDAA